MANFLDTFTGTGTLATHTSDSGHAYSNISGTYDAADMKLDGAGGLYASPGAYGGVKTMPSILVPEQYTLTVVFEIGAFSGSDYANLVLDMADNYGTSIQVTQYLGQTEVYFPDGYGWVVTAPGVHTFVMTRYDGGRAFYRDGVGEDGYNQQAQTADPFAFYLEMTGSSTFKVRSIEISEPSTPSAFWTANTKTTEVFS